MAKIDIQKDPYVTIPVRESTRKRILALCKELRYTYNDLIVMWVEDIEQQLIKK